MGSSKAPATPDYVGAAYAQGQANAEAARISGKMNNPTVYNPYGSQVVSWNGDQPIIRQTLSPKEQAIYNTTANTRQQVGNASLSVGQQLANQSKTAMNFNKAPELVNAGSVGRVGEGGEQYNQAAINAMMSRVNQDTAGQREANNSTLIAQGLRPGTAAYETAMDRLGRQYNDARQQAIIAGGAEASRLQGMDINRLTTNQNLNQSDFDRSLQARQQGISETTALRNQPINEMGALQTGSQINNPFAGGLGFQGGTNVQAGNIQGAVGQQGQASQNIYNQQMASNNAAMGAGAGLLGSAATAYGAYR